MYAHPVWLQMPIPDFKRHLIIDVTAEAAIDSRDILRPAAAGPLGSQQEAFSP